MKWQGETATQWIARTHEWHRIFCWWPTQMQDGNWVWLARVWTRRMSVNGIIWWVYSDETNPPQDAEPPDTPPPSPIATALVRKTRGRKKK